MPPNRVEVSEPKDLFSGSAYDVADAEEPAVGIGNGEDAEAVLSEDALAVAEGREVKVVSDLCAPDAEVLLSKVDFDEGSDNARRCLELEICVGDESQLSGKRLIESEPAH